MDLDRLSDASVIDALRRASDSYVKVEEDVAQKVREACRGARARLLGRKRRAGVRRRLSGRAGRSRAA